MAATLQRLWKKSCARLMIQRLANYNYMSSWPRVEYTFPHGKELPPTGDDKMEPLCGRYSFPFLCSLLYVYLECLFL